MILLNTLEKEPETSAENYRTLLQLVAPFAPHVADELWELNSGKGSIHKAPWPSYDELKLQLDTISIAVQVNGKVRASLTIASDADKIEVMEAAKAHPDVDKWISGKQIKKEIYVPGRLVSLVVD
jgi:leucyl-tRNA synthetase